MMNVMLCVLHVQVIRNLDIEHRHKYVYASKIELDREVWSEYCNKTSETEHICMV